jgi:transposase
LARRTFRCRAWDLGAALDWVHDRAVRAGYLNVTVACEPTGHRWRVVGQLAADRGMSFVCVQPMLSSWARKSEDLTTDKTDDKDAVLIARLTGQLRCYLPEPVDETWARLRYLGNRREQLLGEHVASVQQIRDLLECTWPAALEAAKQPFKSVTWVAAITVVMRRDGGDLALARRRGLARFERAVRREVIRRGRTRPCGPIARRVFTALTDPAGVLAHRRAAFERIEWVLQDSETARTKLADVEARMTAVLDELQLTELVTSIEGLGPVGAAAILAETGDLHRFTSARAVVKHAGLAPRQRLSGTFAGKARLTGAGRPGLRVAAWRAVWGCLQNNRVYAARYRHLTTRETNRLTPTQAQTVIAAAILRQLYAVVVHQQVWNAHLATHGLDKPRPNNVAA